MGLENLIENAIEQLKVQKEHEVIYEDDDEADAALFEYDKDETELTEEDYEEFKALEEQMSQEDSDLFEYLTKEDDADGSE